MKSSADVITEDLELLATQLRDELRRMSGSSVLVAVAGGAGFLGYYLVRPAIETMDANVGGLRHLLDYTVAWTDTKASGYNIAGARRKV